MPQAVTHVLIALVIASIIREFCVKDKKKFPLYYLLIAGVAGLLPDLDIAVYWVLSFFGYQLVDVHRTFTHTLFVPAIFLVLAGIAYIVHKKGNRIVNRNVRVYLVLLMVALGTIIHLVLDTIFSGQVRPFYPLNNFNIGLNLIHVLPAPIEDTILPSFDALLLVVWLTWMVYRHRIHEFV